MLGWLIILFTAVPVVELALLIHVGGYIGAWNTIAIVILTGIAGALLAKSQGFYALYRIEAGINSGTMPGDEILGGLLILCGGVLFLTPGFITDAAGFLLLIPYTRNIFRKIISRKIQNRIDNGRMVSFRRF